MPEEINFRCQFCEINLKSDLDVSKHLDSQRHHESVQKAQRLHPIEKDFTKDVPKNIGILFERLQLRTAKDVRDLEDRGYFKIPSDAPNVVNAANTMSDILRKKLADHLCRNLPAELRDEILKSLDGIKKERPATSSSTQPSTSKSVQRPPSAIQPERPKVSSSTSTVPTPPNPQVSTHSSTTNSAQTSFPASQTAKPVTSTHAAFTAQVATQPINSVQPSVSATLQPSSSVRNPDRHIRPGQPTDVRSPRPHLQIPVQMPSCSLAQRQTPVGQPRLVLRPVPNRPTNRAPRPDHPTISVQQRPPQSRSMQSANIGSSQNRLQTPNTLTTARLPTQVEQSQIPIRPIQAANAQQSMSNPQILIQPSRPSVRQPEQQIRPENTANRPPRPELPAAYSMPRPLVDEPPPQPRLESTYRPRLTIIKIEPKDKI